MSWTRLVTVGVLRYSQILKIFWWYNLQKIMTDDTWGVREWGQILDFSSCKVGAAIHWDAETMRRSLGTAEGSMLEKSMKASKWRCCLTFATRRNHEFKSKMFTAISVLISHSTFLVWASSQVQKLLIEKIVSSQEKWPHNTAASISYDDYFSLAPKLIYSHLFHQVYYLDRQTLGHFKNVDASELILTTRDLKHQSHILLE